MMRNYLEQNFKNTSLYENNPLISIIVPVYNTGSFLKSCLKSICNQTYKNIEVIVINDGSTDNSKEILEEYRLKDSRIRVFHLQNGGIAKARNFGIKQAYGEYIGFVDSDDVIELNMFEILIEKIVKEDTDLSICNYNKIFSEYKMLGLGLEEEVIDLGKLGINSYIINYVITYLHGHEVWNKLYKKDIIIENNIEFISTDLVSTEDCLFNLIYITYISKIGSVKYALYNYIQHSNSYMHKKQLNQMEKYLNLIDIYEKKIVEIEKKDECFEALSLLFFNFFIQASRNIFKWENNINSLYQLINTCSTHYYYKKYMREICFSLSLYKHLNRQNARVTTIILNYLISFLCIINFNYLAALLLYIFYSLNKGIKREVKI